MTRTKKFCLQRAVALTTLGLSGVMGSVGCNAQQTPATGANAQAPVGGANAPRPNVLLILADDLAWSDLSFMGSEINTPNLDALAKGGLTMTQFYNSARCSPTRASLLTGLHPHQAGVANIGPPLSNRAVTIPEVLNPAGYHTSMVGKWHLTDRSTPVNRGFQEFYGMLGGFDNFFKEDPGYTRLPAGRPKREYKPGEFYATDAFGDYSIDFIDQAKGTNKPWFQYLAFTAPHFPLMAPKAAIDKYEKVYEKGWDVIREERLARQKKLGVVPQDLKLTPRSMVPRNWINERTGWADKQNPAWDSLPEDRRKDLARRMAVYGAMVEIMDRNVGRVVSHLKQTNQLDNTLIFFLSDNGACAEWDPFGFDKLDSPLNILHTGAELEKIGASDSYISYGSGWANASNTPFRLYKHYAHEGGIATPLIMHWPAGLKAKAGTLNRQPGYITDIMPTLLELTGAKYPEEHNGHKILPQEGVSLMPVISGGNLAPRMLFMEHEGNRMVRDGDWKLVALQNKPWELYNMASDPTEMSDLAARETARVERLSQAWEDWAVSDMVKPKPSPQVVNKALSITGEVTPEARDGVILAQGGNQRGYALHLKDGKPIFSVRQNGRLYTAAAPTAPTGKFSFDARLEKDGVMTLAINGKIVGRGKAPGVFTTQPVDELSIGEDVLSAVGEYAAPHALKGKVENTKVTAQ